MVEHRERNSGARATSLNFFKGQHSHNRATKKKKKKSAFVDNDVRIMNHFSFFFGYLAEMKGIGSRVAKKSCGALKRGFFYI
jgi:hypothetical protein